MALRYETHDIGRAFWHKIRLEKNTSLVHKHPTNEMDAPYRWSNSTIFRFPFTGFGIVIGWWHSTDRTEEQAVLAALNSRGTEHAYTPEESKRIAREAVSAHATDLDDEWTIVNMLDVV